MNFNVSHIRFAGSGSKTSLSYDPSDRDQVVYRGEVYSKSWTPPEWDRYSPAERSNYVRENSCFDGYGNVYLKDDGDH